VQQIDQKPAYVHYGCGQYVAPREWLNFDASMTLRWEQIPLLGRLYTKNAERFPANVIAADIVKGLPVKDGSCAGVYSSCVLEHLSLTDCHRALANTYALLHDGGIFRVIVPDLEWAAREYLKKLDTGDATANDFFLRATELGEEKRPRTPRELVYAWLRTSKHFWMWDYVSLAAALAQHGFKNIRRCAFGDCEDRMFDLVESPHRFENAVAIEARR
jgi:predicted SAM-dependent methyltransferase